MGERLEQGVLSGEVIHSKAGYTAARYPNLGQFGENIKTKAGFITGWIPFIAGILATNLLPAYIQEWLPVRRVGLGKSCSKLELATLLLGWHFDAASTAIGMQSEGSIGFEGNLQFARWAQLMVEEGKAKTHSQAILYGDYGIMATFFAFWLVFDLKGIPRSLIAGMDGLKAWAGGAWNTLRPKKYKLTDYFKIASGEGKVSPQCVDLMTYIAFLDNNGGPEVWNDAEGNFDMKGIVKYFTGGSGTFQERLDKFTARKITETLAPTPAPEFHGFYPNDREFDKMVSKIQGYGFPIDGQDIVDVPGLEKKIYELQQSLGGELPDSLDESTRSFIKSLLPAGTDWANPQHSDPDALGQ